MPNSAFATETEANISHLNLHGGLQLSPATWSVVGGVTKWVGEKAAAGIVGAAAGMVFNEFMDAIGLGGPDLVGKLDQISNQLTEVQRSLDRLTGMTAEILKQLNELRDFMERGLKIETLLAAMGRINVAYGGGSSEVVSLAETSANSISLRLLTERMPHFAGITPQDLAVAAKSFAAYVTDVPGCIAQIHSVLARAAFGQTPLLIHWAKELAQQVRAGKISRENAYLVLEGYFLHAVSVQLKGLCVHCVALSTGRLGPQFIKQYLQEDFAQLMREETTAYMEAVEHLIFTSLDPIMLTGVKEMDEREFPKHVDEILLRTDLLCAALNLVGYKPADGKPAPSVQAAIQGIYGRSLYRPSDLRNGQAPDMPLNGYSPAKPSGVRRLPFPCLDLIQSEGKATLSDVATSLTSVAHYAWAFPSPTPQAGVPIDMRYRGGATPALYPIFGPDRPSVLAVGIFNGNPLFRGLPAGAAQDAKFTEFGGGNPHVTYSDQTCTLKRHPLSNDPGDIFQTSFRVENAYKAHTTDHSYVVHRLFSYSGKSVKIRLWAHVKAEISRSPRIDIQGGTAFAHEYEIFNFLRLRLPDGSEKGFYDSVHSFGPERPLSLNDLFNRTSKPYSARRSGPHSLDFDLVPGEYHLVFGSEAYFPEARRRYSGWQDSRLSFTLHAVTLEMVF